VITVVKTISNYSGNDFIFNVPSERGGPVGAPMPQTKTNDYLVSDYIFETFNIYNFI
jgi:hypothetical protein